MLAGWSPITLHLQVTSLPPGQNDSSVLQKNKATLPRTAYQWWFPGTLPSFPHWPRRSAPASSHQPWFRYWPLHLTGSTASPDALRFSWTSLNVSFVEGDAANRSALPSPIWVWWASHTIFVDVDWVDTQRNIFRDGEAVLCVDFGSAEPFCDFGWCEGSRRRSKHRESKKLGRMHFDECWSLESCLEDEGNWKNACTKPLLRMIVVLYDGMENFYVLIYVFETSYHHILSHNGLPIGHEMCSWYSGKSHELECLLSIKADPRCLLSIELVISHSLVFPSYTVFMASIIAMNPGLKMTDNVPGWWTLQNLASEVCIRGGCVKPRKKIECRCREAHIQVCPPKASVQIDARIEQANQKGMLVWHEAERQGLESWATTSSAHTECGASQNINDCRSFVFE